MIPRRLLLSLIASLAVLLVAFAVVIAGYALVSVAQDTAAAQALWWVAMSLLMLVLVDLVLLVGVLALRELDRDDE